MTSPSTVDFRVHGVRGGGDEFGRVDFHRMLTALIQVTNPTATEVRADPGDWGIDTYVGTLTGRVSIWQSKYFYDRIGKSQQAQIRESFASAMKHAAANKYRVENWTLCMPATLSAPERRWWERKVNAWRKEFPSVHIDLWDEPALRGKLLARRTPRTSSLSTTARPETGPPIRPQCLSRRQRPQTRRDTRTHSS